MRFDHLVQARISITALLLAGALCPMSSAGVLSVVPDQDNTMYADGSGDNSDGAGIYIFTGTQSSNGYARRALVRFDLSSIPAGSTVNSAQLSMRLR